MQGISRCVNITTSTIKKNDLLLNKLRLGNSRTVLDAVFVVNNDAKGRMRKEKWISMLQQIHNE
jgi:hypothetical protein